MQSLGKYPVGRELIVSASPPVTLLIIQYTDFHNYNAQHEFYYPQQLRTLRDLPDTSKRINYSLQVI